MTSGEQSNRAGWIGRLPTASRCASAVHILTNRSRGRDVTDVTSANFQRWTISMHVCRGVLDNTTAEKTKRSSTEPAGAFVSLKQSMVNRSRYGSLERRYKVLSAWMRYLLKTA
ncbi:hypothetical protein JG688_00011504 [Phytophthora aleatoria]|uniref:Uncharacterized protein n=1 Tax=Phytophthora aleatoria TaxID=2496075 RepID=A0A8J5ILR0_9STRA|nr:hypothetical protein JG688_00011504 [Phytophthora aleatoria]